MFNAKCDSEDTVYIDMASTEDKKSEPAKQDRVEIAVQQICKASFACACVHYFDAYNDYKDGSGRTKVYCCIYTKVDCDLFYMVFVLHCISLMVKTSSSDIFQCYEYEKCSTSDFVNIASPFVSLTREQLKHISTRNLVHYETDTFMRLYCNEDAYKNLIANGLFDGGVYVTEYTGDVNVDL